MHFGMILPRPDSIPKINWQSLQVDIITESIFGYSQEILSHLSNSDRKPLLLNCIDRFLGYIHLMKNFTILAKIPHNLPAAITRRILPGYVEFQEVLKV